MKIIFGRELILAALAGTIASMGLGIIIPLFPIYVSARGATNFELGLIVSGFTISQFLLAPFFGGFSDRHGRKPFIAGGLVCYGLVALLYIFADDLRFVFLVRLLHGVGAGMMWPALNAFIIDKSSVERRGESMGFITAVEMAGFAAGPLLGGGLFMLGGMPLPFLTCSLLAFLAAAMIWGFIPRDLPLAQGPPKTWVARYGFSSMRLADIRLLCLLGFGEAFMWGTISTLLPVMATRAGAPPGKIGWLFSAYFIVYIFVQTAAGKWGDRRGRKQPIILGIAIYTVSVFALSQGESLLQLLIILAIAGAGLGIFAPSVRVAIADLSQDEVRGANMGLFFTTRMFGVFLGPNVSGFLADHFGYGIPFLIGGGGLTLGVVAAFLLSSKLSQGKKEAPVSPAL